MFLSQEKKVKKKKPYRNKQNGWRMLTHGITDRAILVKTKFNEGCISYVIYLFR